MSTSESPDYSLTEEQKAQFLEHGFFKVPNCFTPAQAAAFTSQLWTRLGMSPTLKETWTTERTNMPNHITIPVSSFSPKAWSIICQLLGGEDRISESMRVWNDAFIVNLGKETYDPNGEVKYREIDGWHNDGDFFIHFLDSPEQALLVIPLWSEVVPKGGGTVVATDGIRHIAKHLYDHPEGVNPWMTSVLDPAHEDQEDLTYWLDLARDPSRIRSESFFEMTGAVGDVVFMHPLMMHSASPNLLRHIRIITNPPVSLKEPFCFNRKNKEEYSLVELKTLRDLGMPDGIGEWEIKGERRGWVSSRIKRFEEMRRWEEERIKAEKVAS